MMRVALPYAVLVLVGFGAGFWLGRPARPSGRLSTGVKTESINPDGGVRIAIAAPSLARVLELGGPGGGLRQDAELHETLKTMGAEDFRNAASLWTEEVQQRLQNDEVRAGAILDRWFEVDPASAKAFAEKACTPTSGERMSSTLRFRNTIAARAARHDPKWALEHLLHEVQFLHFGNPNRSVICEVVKRDPALATEWMARMENSKVRESLMAGYVEGIAASDPLAALDLAIAEKGFERLNLIPTAIEAAALQGRGVVLEALAKIDDPGLRRKTALDAMRVLARETTTDIPRFLEATIGDHLNDIVRTPFALNDFIDANPAGAAGWALGLPPKDRPEFLSQVFERWTNIDPHAAKDWIENNASSSEAKTEGPALAELNRLWNATELLEAGNMQDAISAVSSLSDEVLLIGNITEKLALNDPAATADWILSLPEGKTREMGAQTVAWRWVLKDPEAAVAWLEHFPAGKARNGAIVTAIGHVVEEYPEKASRLAALEMDPQSQAMSIRLVYSRWAVRDPEAARNWVRALRGVDERWKTKFLRQNP